MKRSRDAADAAAPDTVVCAFCAKRFKTRGIKQHQNKCSSKKRHQVVSAFPTLDANSFETVLSFLGNQSLVKLQATTGSKYPGSSTLASAICCPCENDELVIANGLCLACNRAKGSLFQDAITATEARKLYGVQKLTGVPHATHPMYRRGSYSFFKFEDVQSYVVKLHGSKMAWMENLAVKLKRRRKFKAAAERKEEEAYNALLAKFSSGFGQFIRDRSSSRLDASQLREKATRYDAIVAALSKRGLAFQDDSRCSKYVMYGGFKLDGLVDSVFRKCEFARFVETLPSAFVQYMGEFELHVRQDRSLALEQNGRYDTMVAALAARSLKLRSDSCICRQFVMHGSGQIDDIVDTMEEMKFLYDHTSYSSDCHAQRPYHRHHHYYDNDSYDSYDFDDDVEYQVSVIAVRDQVKKRIRDRLLSCNPQGLTLPRKWERMR